MTFTILDAEDWLYTWHIVSMKQQEITIWLEIYEPDVYDLIGVSSAF